MPNNYVLFTLPLILLCILVENILLDEEDNVKVADFGLSTTVQKNGIGSGSAAGTPLYMAPEALFPEEYEVSIIYMYWYIYMM